jgi:hypothetical protein
VTGAGFAVYREEYIDVAVEQYIAGRIELITEPLNIGVRADYTTICDMLA